MDDLSRTLETVHPSGTALALAELDAPWALELGPCFRAMAHVVTSGSAVLEIEGEPARVLGPRDVVVVPGGEPHRIGDRAGRVGVHLMALVRRQRARRVRIQGGGAHTTLVSALFALDASGVHPVASILPRVIVLAGENQLAPRWLDESLALMESLASSREPGASGLLDRLMGTLLVQAVQAYVAALPASADGPVVALRDRQLGPILGLIHRQPARPWTVASLASRAGISRSRFATRFTSIVGQSPMEYLRKFRMHTAALELRRSERSVQEVAESVGYDSEATFSRAFKRVVGEPPGAYGRRFASRAAPGAKG